MNSRPTNSISVSKICPETVSGCSKQHIKTVLGNDQAMLKMARELALLCVTPDNEGDFVPACTVRAKAFALLHWLEE